MSSLNLDNELKIARRLLDSLVSEDEIENRSPITQQIEQIRKLVDTSLTVSIKSGQHLDRAESEKIASSLLTAVVSAVEAIIPDVDMQTAVQNEISSRFKEIVS